MAELVDALASGASVSNDVEVQVLSAAPRTNFSGNLSASSALFLWFLLRKTNEKAALAGDKIMDYSKMVRERGLEPPRLAAYAPKAYVSTNSTTRA